MDAADVRELVTDVNDGIIAVAGMGLGLAGAEVSAVTTYAVVCISALAGALSVFGVRLGETFANREAQLSTVAQERRLLELSPEEEIAELALWFETKGVSPDTSRAVAQELSQADALSAQLEIEYGIRELTSSRHAWRDSVAGGVAFAVGALVPVLVTVLMPFAWRTSYTVVTAVGSLIVTSVVLSRLGHSHVWFTILRSVLVGLGSLGITYALGDWLL